MPILSNSSRDARITDNKKHAVIVTTARAAAVVVFVTVEDMGDLEQVCCCSDVLGLVCCSCLGLHIFFVPTRECNIGALIITYTILGVPYYKFCIMGPNNYFNY